MLNDQVVGLINPRVESLARRWSDRLVEIREAVQSLLLERLRRLDQNGNLKLIQLQITTKLRPRATDDKVVHRFGW